MKRSKILLGITSLLLAIAGFTTAKHYGLSVIRWYVTYGGICATVASSCENTGPQVCKYAYTYAMGGIHFNATSVVFSKGGASGAFFVQANGTTVCVNTLKFAHEP